jgi:asparagine synthase (glutamine-hydrolysing)
MMTSLWHRGPDDEGSICLPGAALGMRRLAIIDVNGGQQPFSNEDNTLHVVANGEIYNFLDVRARLESKGHRFRSRCDIEVLVHAYEEWGDDFLSRVQGMFAIALWDAKNCTLVAARDRAGEKPLFYTQTDRAFYVGSEIKALLTRPEVSRSIDHEALDQFLTYEYVVAPTTMFRDIKKLQPGHLLKYANGRIRTAPYWTADRISVRPWTDADAVEALRAELRRAVRSQMMSDVPLGVFLSGGIDSSAIVAFMAEAARDRNTSVNTFSMGFDDGSYNELPFARAVARHFATNHREGVVTPKVHDLFGRLVTHLDEPFADVSLFPTFLVSQMAREHVTVALAGDGGDELFAGYDRYRAEALARRVGWAAPAVALRALDAVLSWLPPSDQKKGAVNKAKRFVAGLARQPASIGHYRWMSFLGVAEKHTLYTPRFKNHLLAADPYAPVREALGREQSDWLNRELLADLRIYLADDILVKVDRMSMATSLETRAPFLDAGVMELALSMPSSLKYRGGERKWVLKQALRDLVPPEILTRRKEGFSIPMKQWLRHELAPLMESLLAPERLAKRGLIDSSVVSRMVAEHRSGRENHAHVLFSLMVFERWAEEHLPAA